VSTPRDPERILPPGTAYHFDDAALRISLAARIYPLGAILRSCYWLTDRCFVHLSPVGDETIEVTLLAKNENATDTDQLAWDFLNDLLDQRLRLDINDETRAVRELIVTQAFAEVDVINDRGEPVKTDGGDPPPTEDIRNWRPVS